MKRESKLPSIICIQETWLSDLDNLALYELSDYTFLSYSKTSSQHGGVGMYVHRSIKFKKLVISHKKDIWDGLFIEIIDNNNKKLIVGNIYRPPRSSAILLQKFNDDFTAVIQKFRVDRELVVAGDFNIDLLKIDANKSFSDFFESLTSLAILPRITHPTRITRRSQTLIDNFYCRVKYDISEICSGILMQTFSDHQPYFIILKSQTSYIPCPNGHVSYREKKPGYLQVFHDQFMSTDLSRIDNLLISDNPNSMYDQLDTALSKCLDVACPVVNRKFNRYKDKKNPWMTSGLIKMIKKRDKILKRKKASSGSTLQKFTETLNEYNKKLKQNIYKAKKDFYHNRFSEFKNDAKKTWRLLNDILGKNKSRSFPDVFIEPMKMEIMLKMTWKLQRN